jgi:hypothetical protein
MQAQVGLVHNESSGQVHLTRIERCRPMIECDATCPDGGPLSLTWEHATPNGQVAVLFSPAEGHTRLPQGKVCAGTVLDLAPKEIEVIFLGSAGPLGTRTLFVKAAKSSCGGYLQLLNLSNCTTSNTTQLK